MGVQRHADAFHTDNRTMMTAGLVLLAAGVVIALLSLRRRGSKHADLGRISDAWLAEESTSGPRRY
jgi:hypothetical protein